jgi:hypothetical protein
MYGRRAGDLKKTDCETHYKCADGEVTPLSLFLSFGRQRLWNSIPKPAAPYQK